MRFIIFVASWKDIAIAFLLPKNKLESTNKNVASTRSLELILLSLSLQVDDDDVSMSHSTKFTFQFSVKIECFELIEEVINFRNTS